jgi:hypothetical protein
MKSKVPRLDSRKHTSRRLSLLHCGSLCRLGGLRERSAFAFLGWRVAHLSQHTSSENAHLHQTRASAVFFCVFRWHGRQVRSSVCTAEVVSNRVFTVIENLASVGALEVEVPEGGIPFVDFYSFRCEILCLQRVLSFSISEPSLALSPITVAQSKISSQAFWFAQSKTWQSSQSTTRQV